MHKKLVIMMLVVQFGTFLFAFSASAAPWSPPQSPVQQHQLSFLSVRNEYQLRYAIGGLPEGTYQVRANFWSTTNVYYDTVFDNPTKIAYLTCNGTYIFEMLDVNGNTIAETVQIHTTKIKNPPCQSYENGGLKNDINLKGEINGDGHLELTWDAIPGAKQYEIYVDGIFYDSNADSLTVTKFYGDDMDKLITIVALNDQDQVIGSGDYIRDVSEGGNGGNNGGGDNGGGGNGGNGACDACKMLTDALECPAWNDYMGELTQAIKDALPPPPDWDEVASTFVDHFADYFGDVPAVPTVNEIQNNLDVPTLDTNVPNADITPTVPSEFNDGPLDTDITSGEVIEIVDESEPFEIMEPDHFINADDVGEMVYPNDPRNSSDGIKQPDQIDTGYTIPTPTVQEGSDIPPSDIPTPGMTETTMPTHKENDYIIPVPGKID